MATMAVSTLGLDGLDIIFKDRPLKVALIGSGWYGKSDLFRLIQVSPVEVIAICDVDKKMLVEAAFMVSKRQKSGKVPLQYIDYRKMLAEHKLDLVLIGSPDHWHALQAIESMKAGAHLYLQKPISLDIVEGEAILAAAKKYNKVVQVGTQRRSTHHLMDAKSKVIESGMLGKISHVEMCCYYHMRMNAKPEIIPVPDHFDYEMWAGPSPKVPFRGLPHRSWRAYKEYGNGIVGDMCVHMLDTVRWLLDLGWPKKVSSTGGIYVQKDSVATTSDTQNAVFEFDELNCIWQHRSWGTPPDPDYPWGFFIYGEKGTLKGSVHKYEFIPHDKNQKNLSQNVLMEKDIFPGDVKEKGMEIHVAPATRSHMLDLLSCIETGNKPRADVLNGHISTASCIMANMSMDLGRALVYNPESKVIDNDKEANDLLAREYRKPWKHPGE